MEYRNLGAAGLKVPPLCLGAMTFGEADASSMMHGVSSDFETSRAIMNRALDAGLCFIDTADVYGQDGLSERVMGEWFERDKRRDEVILATKVRFRMRPGPNGGGASRVWIMRGVEDSLRRMKTDRIDLYQLHMQDIDVPEEETLRALDDLVRSGKVLYIGSSNYAAYRLVESLMRSEQRGWSRFVSAQMQYSLLTRDIEREHVPLALRFGVGILPWSPLAGGFLSGKYERGKPAPENARLGVSDRWRNRFVQYDNDRAWGIVDVLRAVAREVEATPSAVAIAWVLARPAVTSVIFGARSTAQLDENLAALKVKLGAEQMKRLEDASRFDVGYPYSFIGGIQGRW